MKLEINDSLKGLLQPLTAEEYADLKASILAEGCRDAICVWNGVIVDGHNRYEICQRHSVEFKIIEMSFDDTEAAADWMDRNQLARRNLTPDMMRLLRGRRYERTKKADGVRGKQKLGQNEPASTAEKIAHESGVSPATVKRDAAFARAVEADPELKRAVMERKPVQKIIREQKRAQIAQGLVDNPMPSKRFGVIYCDPPWKYEHSKTHARDIENNYPTMDTDDIANIEIPSGDNCVLVMWATAPKLLEALSVMDAWGFHYRTCAVWDKEIIGMGYWFRGQHEMILIGVKGKVSPPAENNRFPSVIKERRTKHSKKPDCIYDMIEKMFPGMEYIELFARKKHSEKWEVWGNQIG